MTWIERNENPLDVFSSWYEEAIKVTSFEPTKMTLATVDSSGMPSARVVLLKGYDESGFSFFTNYESKKSKELIESAKGALCFHWDKPHHRQIRVRGLVEKLSKQESEDYFKTRVRGSQIGAWASPQSQVLESREDLVARISEFENKFGDDPIPCPPHWGGFRLKPLVLEFWESQEFRLHDRIIFERDSIDASWQSNYLAP